MKRTHLISATLIAFALSACGQAAHDDSIFTTGSGHSHGANTVIGDTPPPPPDAQVQATVMAVSFDAQFINNMAAHHNGAIQMAEQALQESQRSEIKQLAEHIIDDQHKEIQQMAIWLEQWYPGARVSADQAAPMEAMEISQDQSKPFDLRFLEAMIWHHQGALSMAREAQAKAEHPELKQLAGEIIKAQSAEIDQMQTWQRQWFPN